jgi:autophagy-related protein 2
MSQSLATLPPRRVEADVESSVLFHSALSTLPEVSEAGGDGVYHAAEPASPSSASSACATVSHSALDHETLLSLDSESFFVHIVLYFPSATQAQDAFLANEGALPSASSAPIRTASVSITSGVLAFAIQPWVVSALAELADAVASQNSPTISPPPSQIPKGSSVTSPFSILHEVELSVHVRGIILLCLPSGGLSRDDMCAFFSQPLVPPRLPSSYVRLFIDALNGNASVSTIDSRTSAAKHLSSQPQVIASPSTSHVSASLAISDISLVVISPETPTSGDGHQVQPILITDPYLPLQYNVEHHPPPALADVLRRQENAQPLVLPLPDLAHVDWLSSSMKINKVKLSHWRAKAPPRQRHVHPFSAEAVVASPSSPQSASPGSGREYTLPFRAGPAASFRFDTSLDQKSGGVTSRASLTADFAPLHIFCDLRRILGRVEDERRQSQALQFLLDITDRMSRLLPPPKCNIGDSGVSIARTGAPLTESSHQTMLHQPSSRRRSAAKGRSLSISYCKTWISPWIMVATSLVHGQSLCVRCLERSFPR